MSYYYRTSDPATVAVVKQFDADRAALHAKANEFALLIGENVKALMYSTTHKVSFAGVKLPNDAKGALLNPALWSSVNNSAHELRRPLKKVAASVKEHSKALHAIWDKRPQEEVSRDPVFAIAGLSWSDFIFGGTFSYFLYNEVLYIECSSADKTGKLFEILTSAYASAKAAFEEENKNAKSN